MGVWNYPLRVTIKTRFDIMSLTCEQLVGKEPVSIEKVDLVPHRLTASSCSGENAFGREYPRSQIFSQAWQILREGSLLLSHDDACGHEFDYYRADA